VRLERSNGEMHRSSTYNETVAIDESKSDCWTFTLLIVDKHMSSLIGQWKRKKVEGRPEGVAHVRSGGKLLAKLGVLGLQPVVFRLGLDRIKKRRNKVDRERVKRSDHRRKIDHHRPSSFPTISLYDCFQSSSSLVAISSGSITSRKE
jgi:hypothetical protein